jgi:hypothetical protein
MVPVPCSVPGPDYYDRDRYPYTRGLDARDRDKDPVPDPYFFELRWFYR